MWSEMGEDRARIQGGGGSRGRRKVREAGEAGKKVGCMPRIRPEVNREQSRWKGRALKEVGWRVVS